MISLQRLTWIGKIAAGLLVTLMGASCGQFFPSSDTIVSITLSPTSAQIKPMGTQQFTATGKFGDNSTGDVTSRVTWVSSATNIATIDANGLATAVALGTTRITAKSGSVTSPASVLTVSNKTILSISVTPQNQTISVGTQQPYTATANYSDGSFGDITGSASWNSSNTGVATITSPGGVATAVAAGQTTISASLSGVVGTTNLTVQ